MIKEKNDYFLFSVSEVGNEKEFFCEKKVRRPWLKMNNTY